MHTGAAFPLYLPAAHAEQCTDKAVLYCPAEHAVQEDAPDEVPAVEKPSPQSYYDNTRQEHNIKRVSS